MRRIDAWTAKVNTISAEISVRRARVQATGKSDADTIYDSMKELDPPTGTTGDGTDLLTPGQSSVDDAGGRISDIVSPELSMVKSYKIDAAAKAARDVPLEPSPTPGATKGRPTEPTHDQGRRSEGATTAKMAPVAKRNLSSELMPQTPVGVDEEQLPLGRSGAQNGLGPPTAGSGDVPTEPAAETNPATKAAAPPNGKTDGQDDCVHEVSGVPRPRPTDAVAAATQHSDHPTQAPQGACDGPAISGEDQPLLHATCEHDAPPDQHHHDQPTETPRDASGGSVPTTAETEKPPGHLEASGPTALTQTGGVNTAEGDSNHQGQIAAQLTPSDTTDKAKPTTTKPTTLTSTAPCPSSPCRSARRARCCTTLLRSGSTELGSAGVVPGTRRRLPELWAMVRKFDISRFRTYTI
eukprot:SAG11_NODE_576_length_8397_cov_13.729091_1_plen_409_part_10